MSGCFWNKYLLPPIPLEAIMSSAYDDILNFPHHTSTVQPAMPMQNRAAQFAPFAALVGYDALIQETTRLTDQKPEFDESVISELNEKLRLLLELMPQHPEVTITYFQPDSRKTSGAYRTTSGIIRKFLHNENILVMECEKCAAEYQQAIRLAGKACGIPRATTEEHLRTIDTAKDEVRRKNAGEEIEQSVIPEEIVPNWMPMDIHETVMAIFEASLYLEQEEERCALYATANFLLEAQSYEDWLVNLAGGGVPGQKQLA